MSIVQSIKFGYRWTAGNGTKIRFWEDTWFGSSPVAVQFWPLYIICIKTAKTKDDIWDGTQLNLTFRRIFYDWLMELWYQLLEIACSIIIFLMI